jgi:uncharacterized membrane protein
VIRRLVQFVLSERVLVGAVLVFATAVLAGAVALWIWNAMVALVAGMYLASSGEALIRAVADSARPVSREHRRTVRKVESAIRQADLQNTAERAS